MAANEKEIQHAVSDAIDRAESAQQRMVEATKGVVEDASNFYELFFSVNGSRRVAKVYIETSQKMANEALDFARRFVQLSAEGARKFWQIEEERRPEIYTH
jgi:hypothetical protein